MSNITFDMKCIRSDPQAGICEQQIPGPSGGSSTGATGPTGSTGHTGPGITGPTGASGPQLWEIFNTSLNQPGVRLNYTTPYPGVVDTLDFVVPRMSTEGVGSRLMFDMSRGAVRGGNIDGGGTGMEWDDVNRGVNSTAFGLNTTASGNSSTVSGGKLNTATGNSSTVSGGELNTATGDFSTVSGGEMNTATGDFSTVGGGFFNLSQSLNSFIGGGNRNQTAMVAQYSTVCGGDNNMANGSRSFVGGGSGNIANGAGSTVCGGQTNIAFGATSFIGGGIANQTNELNSGILCGTMNDVSAGATNSSVIAGNMITATLPNRAYAQELETRVPAIQTVIGPTSRIGRNTLVVGGFTGVSPVSLTATTDHIILTNILPGGTPGAVFVSTRVNGGAGSFIIQSTNPADRSTIGWIIVSQT